MGEIRSERQERRAQRRQQAEARRANRPQQPAPTPAADERKRNFIQESLAELQKVEWPNQSQVIQGTVVVLVACVVVGVYLYINDEVWKQVVEKILLGQ
jgi:preprotein translocase subunit SecE